MFTVFYPSCRPVSGEPNPTDKLVVDYSEEHYSIYSVGGLERSGVDPVSLVSTLSSIIKKPIYCTVHIPKECENWPVRWVKRVEWVGTDTYTKRVSFRGPTFRFGCKQEIVGGKVIMSFFKKDDNERLAQVFVVDRFHDNGLYLVSETRRRSWAYDLREVCSKLITDANVTDLGLTTVNASFADQVNRMTEEGIDGDLRRHLINHSRKAGIDRTASTILAALSTTILGKLQTVVNRNSRTAQATTTTITVKTPAPRLMDLDMGERFLMLEIDDDDEPPCEVTKENQKESDNRIQDAIEKLKKLSAAAA